MIHIQRVKQKHNQNKLVASVAKLTLMACLATVAAACQTVKPVHNTSVKPVKQEISFRITGKIGIHYLDNANERQHASAFYAWGQQADRFAIDISGALGMGKTHITGNKTYANLLNDKNNLTANSPEALLFKTTRWYAPISQLPYWVVGKQTPSAVKNQYDEKQRLIKSIATNNNSAWLVTLSYRDNQYKPRKIKMQRLQLPAMNQVAISSQAEKPWHAYKGDGNQVIMTISHH